MSPYSTNHRQNQASTERDFERHEILELESEDQVGSPPTFSKTWGTRLGETVLTGGECQDAVGDVNTEIVTTLCNPEEGPKALFVLSLPSRGRPDPDWAF